LSVNARPAAPPDLRTRSNARYVPAASTPDSDPSDGKYEKSEVPDTVPDGYVARSPDDPENVESDVKVVTVGG
jgi:hypothetical protein